MKFIVVTIFNNVLEIIKTLYGRGVLNSWSLSAQYGELYTEARSC
jgi:hypothetical protein